MYPKNALDEDFDERTIEIHNTLASSRLTTV